MPCVTTRAPARRRRRCWAWRYRRLLFLVSLLGFTALAGTLFLLARAPLPDERVHPQTTFLADATGTRLASLDAGENRVPVKLGQVPAEVVDAVVAVEDRNFYRHSGLDPLGILRAVLADLRGGEIRQGGSTITQQYVKNAYLGRERTIWRKLKEASLAVKVERRYTKDEILERYLNIVYLGRGAYGVQAASRAYFGKNVGELGLEEAAYLAGLIRAPETADVARDPVQAKARRDRVLGALERRGRLTSRQREAAEAVPLPADEGGYVLDPKAQEPVVAMADKGTQYFVEHVRQELVARYGEEVTYRGGLRVRTTLDLGLQAQAYDAVYGLLNRADDPAGALVALDDNGEVKAMVGGRDFAASKVNLTLGREGGGTGRQAGSTFKPFVLAAVVRNGYTVESAFPAPPEIILPGADDGRDYRVTNYEDADFGPSLNLIDATRNSVNTVYAQAQLALGAQKVVETARAAGIERSSLEPNASLALGTDEVSVIEMATAFSTFANRGVLVRPRAVLEVTAADGTLLERTAPAPARVMEREHADVVTHCLQQVVVRGSGAGAAFGRLVAGKTGTTQDFGDAWFVGYTPKLTTAVWMGYPEGNTRKMVNVRGRKVNGGSFPATIFRRFMQSATRNHQYTGDFPIVTRFPGRVLKPARGVVFPTSSTTTSSTTARPRPHPAVTTTNEKKDASS
jgi:penicillin-binding protein 1A